MSDYREFPWDNKPGFKERKVDISRQPAVYDSRYLKAFIESVNLAKQSYMWVTRNCQEFIRDLMVFLEIEDSWACFFKTAQQAIGVGISWLSRGSSQSSSCLLRQILNITPAFIQDAVKSGANFIGRRPLVLGASEGVIDFIKEILKSLIINAQHELVEAVINATRGAFTWWQLLQIPVELGVRLLMESEWFQETFGYHDPGGKWAYAASKLASVGVAGLVGLCVTGGGWGFFGAVLVWFVQELLTFGLRMLSGFVSTHYTHDGGDFFDKWIGESKTLQLFNWIFNTDYHIPRHVRQAED
ncbi:uncharacterized protein LOC134856340 [Symsagittifera roscoffensis]|uniref:uncharacterized protein LOC134856340 n=1 Tax=Symsagittifera roscoffensis TaxID=84072 RepID=UPI00307B3036